MEGKIPVKKTSLAGLLALCLTPAVAMAQIVVRIAPPAPIVEVHNRPPHPGAVWVAHHWERRGEGWVLIEGYWR